MEKKNSMKALFIIVNAGHVDDVMDIVRTVGVLGATIINSRGNGSRHEVFMGITVDSEKEVVLCIVSEETAIKAMEALREKAGIKTPAHSICFTLPVEQTVGITPEYAELPE